MPDRGISFCLRGKQPCRHLLGSAGALGKLVIARSKHLTQTRQLGLSRLERCAS
jgi:hypothetical protein